MPVFFSHLSSCFGITKDSRAEVLFPGRREVPEGSCGYVRATHVAPLSWRYRNGDPKADHKLPFRDYPDSVRTRVVGLFQTPYDKHRVVVSARNVLNEWPYQARIGGDPFRRYEDPDVPDHFPVVVVKSDGLAVCPFAGAPPDADILTGLPLVIDSQSMGRDFLIAHSSDITHSYACHPEGLFGPKPPAWQEISDAWHSEWTKWKQDPTRNERERAAHTDEVAARFEGWPKSHDAGADRSHSVIVDTGDDNVYAMVLTGTLWSIAAFLRKHGVCNALVMDQSGSVNYCYLAKDAKQPQPIASTTNWRDSGTCFLAIDTGGYVTQEQHPWMPRTLGD